MKAKIKKRSFIDATASGTLSDLGFLLIIYFIVIAGFTLNQGFIINLPQKNSTKIVNVEDIMKLYLDVNGDITYNNKTVSYDELKGMIKEKVSIKPNMVVLLKIDPEVVYQKVVDIINMAKELNIDNFSFSIKKDET